MKRVIIGFVLMASIYGVQAQDQKEANYDEAKVPKYVLPDVLKTTSNVEVKNTRTWENSRRPELLKLFENNIYGQMPKKYSSIKYTVTKEDATAMNGKAKLKQVMIEVFNNNNSVRINLILFIPNAANKPVPAFLLINNRERDNTDPTRTKKSEFWPAEMLVDSGYAIAAIHVSDLAPDDKEKYVEGVLQLYPEQLTAANGMKAISAWAWGASRVMDYFATDTDIDAKRVAVVGHSRGGKASLLAAAEDQRFALCITNCSGNTGAALARSSLAKELIVLTPLSHTGLIPIIKSITIMKMRCPSTSICLFPSLHLDLYMPPMLQKIFGPIPPEHF
jgi:hypothetical protein